MEIFLHLGESAQDYGVIEQRHPHHEVTTCLSVGADPDSPSLAAKGSRSQPNEDGLLVAREGSRFLLAVADSHFGCAASHRLLTHLSERLASIPESTGELALLCLGLCDPPWDDDSASTLLVLVVDCHSGEFFGYSWGDCSAVQTVGQRVLALTRDDADVDYISNFDAPEPDRAEVLGGTLERGDSLLLFTDGINECHYRNPDTSLNLLHLQQLLEQHKPPRDWARAVVEAALQGVGGFPGGQDNIALICLTRPEGLN